MAKSRFHGLLEARILELVQSKSASLASGAAVDYSHYTKEVGYLNGLMDALKLCEDIERDLDA